MTWTLICDDPSLVIEASRLADEVRASVSFEVVQGPTVGNIEGPIALALLRAPTPEELVALGRSSVPMALIDAPDAIRAVASDLGHPTVDELRPLISILQLRDAAEHPWTASVRVEALDRQRLKPIAEFVRDRLVPRNDHRLVSADEGRIAYEGDHGTSIVGEARDVAAALEAMLLADHQERPKMPHVEGVEASAVLDVILGPARTLSDPASKATLAAYDVPLPLEELCSSPSRTASEASRMGYPVRVALASPDLRIAEHPDLAAERLDNASRVRDAFRQIMTLAKERAPNARLLGVTVSATRASAATLWVKARALNDQLVLAEIGFSDPHGEASSDHTAIILPCRAADIERGLARLQGSSLLLADNRAERRTRVKSIGDTLYRVGALLRDWRTEIATIELRPLALLVGGEVEVQEAYVTVTDAFERSLEAIAAG